MLLSNSNVMRVRPIKESTKVYTKELRVNFMKRKSF